MPELYFGTWYTIAIPANVSTNVCSQVSIQPRVGADSEQAIDYFGGFTSDGPRGPRSVATGELLAIDDTSPFADLDPLYQLQLFFTLPDGTRFVFGDSDFWIVGAAGDGTTDSAIITYACPRDLSSNTQMFFLSREPFLVPPVTFDVLDNMARQAISNYDDFTLLQVPQQQGWCDYAFQSTWAGPAAAAVECTNLDEIQQNGLGVDWMTAEMFLTILTLLTALSTLVWLCVRAKRMPESSSLSTSLLLGNTMVSRASAEA